MVFLFLVASFIDILGIGLVAPYISSIINTDDQSKNLIYSILRENGLVLNYSEFVIFFGLLLVLIFTFKTVFAIFINKSILSFSFNTAASLRISLMRVYLYLPYLKYIQRNSSEYIHNLNLAEKFSGTHLQPLLRLLSDGIVAIMIFFFLAFSNFLALIIMVVLFLSLIIVYDYFFRPKVHIYGKNSNIHSTKILKTVNEAISGIRDIRVFGKEKFFIDIVESEANNYANAVTNSQIITKSPRYLMELLMILFIVTFVWISLLMFNGTNEIVPTISMFAVAGLRLIPAMNSIIASITSLRFSRDSSRLLYEDIKNLRPYESQLVFQKNDFDERFQSIKLSKINFRYPNSKEPILRNIELQVYAGDVIGIMGESGSGKSTLVNLIMGLLEKDSGTFLFNNKKINHKNISQLRAKTSYLPQSTFIIDDSLKNNIALGEAESDIDLARIRASIKSARLSDLVKNLPFGIETNIGERGVSLSGGQIQRVAIARALYFQKEILILDESTSALDSKTESYIVDHLLNIDINLTLIIIAHKESILEKCDHIYEISNGNINKLN